MLSIAFYGKGGIGKSTVSSNIAAALAEQGLKVMMIGCDPKSDCTMNLRGGEDILSVSEILRKKARERLDIREFVYGKEIIPEEIVYEGYKGIICIEAGGPEPGVGCAGRGIVVAVDTIRRIGVFERYRPDVVIYDILGDIVCGGFGLNLRQGMADKAIIVTSSDYLSIYAANNICKGIRRFAERGGTRLSGLIYNVRGLLDDKRLVEEFAKEIGTEVIGYIPLSEEIAESEIYGQTVIERFPDSRIADVFREISRRIIQDKGSEIPNPLPKEELLRLARRIRERVKRSFSGGNNG